MPPRVLIALAALLVAPGCVPRDPERTSDEVRARGLRVGVVPQPPWACVAADGTPRGAEVELARRLADALGVATHWVVGGETELMAGLERFELDLVVGGVTEDSPYAESIGFTRPYFTDERGRAHVFAAPPGENAWVMRLERFLAADAVDADALIRRSATACTE